MFHEHADDTHGRQVLMRRALRIDGAREERDAATPAAWRAYQDAILREAGLTAGSDRCPARGGSGVADGLRPFARTAGDARERARADAAPCPPEVVRADRTHTFPEALYAAWAEAGLFRLALPRIEGGLGGRVLDLVLVAEDGAAAPICSWPSPAACSAG